MNTDFLQVLVDLVMQAHMIYDITPHIGSVPYDQRASHKFM